MNSFYMHACLFLRTWIEARAISNCSWMDRKENKTKPFFFSKIFRKFPLVTWRLKPDFEHQLTASNSASTREFKKKPWVECNVTFKKKADWFILNHQVLCLKTWEEKSMTFSVSVYGTLTSSWTVRTILYHGFVSFLSTDGKTEIDKLFVVQASWYLKERQYCQFLRKIPPPTSRTASFTNTKK